MNNSTICETLRSRESRHHASIITKWAISAPAEGHKVTLVTTIEDWTHNLSICLEELEANKRIYHGEKNVHIPAHFWRGDELQCTTRLTVFDEMGKAVKELSTSCSFSCKAKARIEGLDKGTIKGWIIDETNTSRELKAEVEVLSPLYSIQKHSRHCRQDVAKRFRTAHRTRHGITAELKAEMISDLKKQSSEAITIVIAAKEGEIKTILAEHTEIPTKSDLAISLLRAHYDKDIVETVADKAQADTNPYPNCPYIVIPVYEGLDETINCVRTALSSTHDGIRIVIINDCSPNEELAAELKILSDKHKRIELITNRSNLGFPGSVNIGLAWDKSKDVIILNSDTVCPQADWVERLAKSAYFSCDIGTVTPLTSNGTICAYPIPNRDNTLPCGLDETTLDKILAEANRFSAPVTAPTGVGFCMYIKRLFLDETGFLDQEKWKKGYCEENDLCLRGFERGWRSVISGNVFVKHLGSVSFKDDKRTLIEKNIAILHEMYPYYRKAVKEFIECDPALPLRVRANRLIAMRQSKDINQKAVVHISHNLGGGIKRYISGWAEQVGQARRIIKISPYQTLSSSLYIVEEWIDREKSFFAIKIATEKDLMLMLEALGCDIYIHSLLGYSLDFIRNLGNRERRTSQHIFILHDYSFICPRYTLLRPEKGYCGIKPDAICNICITDSPMEPAYVDNQGFITHNFVYEWRSAYRAVLASCSRIISPSNAALEIARPYLPRKAEKLVIPNDNIDNDLCRSKKTSDAAARKIHSPASDFTKIAVIGAIGNHKGYKKLLELARLVEDTSQRVSIVVIGYTRDDIPFKPLKRTKITGPYQEKDLKKLLQLERPTCALFLSLWPETFSYTLSSAFAARLPCVSLNIGAQASRILDTGFGIVVDVNASPDTVLSACIKASSLSISHDTV